MVRCAWSATFVALFNRRFTTVVAIISNCERWGFDYCHDTCGNGPAHPRGVRRCGAPKPALSEVGCRPSLRGFSVLQIRRFSLPLPPPRSLDASTPRAFLARFPSRMAARPNRALAIGPRRNQGSRRQCRLPDNLNWRFRPAPVHRFWMQTFAASFVGGLVCAS